MVFVGIAKPPVNLKGGEGGVSDSGMLNSTGSNCSMEMVWLQHVNTDKDAPNEMYLQGEDAICHDVENYLTGERLTQGRLALNMGWFRRQ